MNSQADVLFEHQICCPCALMLLVPEWYPYWYTTRIPIFLRWALKICNVLWALLSCPQITDLSHTPRPILLSDSYIQGLICSTKQNSGFGKINTHPSPFVSYWFGAFYTNLETLVPTLMVTSFSKIFSTLFWFQLPSGHLFPNGLLVCNKRTVVSRLVWFRIHKQTDLMGLSESQLDGAWFPTILWVTDVLTSEFLRYHLGLVRLRLFTHLIRYPLVQSLQVKYMAKWIR